MALVMVEATTMAVTMAQYTATTMTIFMAVARAGSRTRGSHQQL